MSFLRRERGNRILRRLDRWLGVPLTLPAAAFRKLSKKRARFTAPASVGILCLGAIGDLLLVSALADGIRRIFPYARLEIIASAANAAALPLIPGLDGSFAAPVSRLPQILRHIRGREFDVLIDTSQWSRLGNLLCNLSGSGTTVGFATKGQYRSLGYDVVCEHRSDRDEVGNFLALGRSLWPEFEGAPGLRLPAPKLRKDKIIYCHFWPARGRGRELKQWPEVCWARLISRIALSGYSVSLTGGKEDADANEKFLTKYFPNSRKVASIAGRANLVELASQFVSAACVVSVNTGVMHLAALAGAPTVGLHGATNPLRWGPVGPNAIGLLPRSGEFAYLNLGFEYPRNARPAMANLPVCDALAAMARLNVRIL